MENAEWAKFNRIAFSVLNPLCKSIVKCPKEESLIDLQNVIFHIPPEQLQLYQRYICVPLCLALVKENTRLEIKRHVMDCMVKLISKTKICDLDLFLSIFSKIFRVISDSSLEVIARDIPEELKLGVMECAANLMSNATNDVLIEFYVRKNLPLLSHGIYVTLNLINDELFLDLRISALKCLMHLCQVFIHAQSHNLDYRVKVGNILMHCLPGIILNLRKAITVDEKQNHKITLLAVRAWSRITALVMEDYISSDSTFENNDWVKAQLKLIKFVEKQKSNHGIKNAQESTLEKLKSEKRTNEWCTNASKSMFAVVDDICHLYFKNWKVRQEMVSSAELLLLHCSRNMKECVPSLVEMLLVLSEDDVPEVSKRSRIVLSKFSGQYGDFSSDAMEEYLLKVARKLSSPPQVEEDLIKLLNLMCGYLRMLSFRIKKISKSFVHLSAISSALIGIITMDYFIISPMEDWSIGTSDEDILKASIPWKCFKNFKNKQIFSKFKEVCHLLGQYADLSSILYYFLDLFSQEPEMKKEIILIINEIFSNVSLSDPDLVAPIIKRIVMTYLDPEEWDYVKSGSIQENRIVINSSVSDIRSRTVQACLLVEGLGMLSDVAVSKEMKLLFFDSWYFRTCLYPILERVGNPSPMLAGAGKLALAHISHVTEMPISSVIQSNADYLSHHLVVKLRRSSEFSTTAPLNVLVGILEFATPDMLKNMEEAVKCVLDYGFKYENTTKTMNCLKCMYVYTKFVKKAFVQEENLGLKQKNNEDNACNSDSERYCTSNPELKDKGIVTQRILHYLRTRKLAHTFSDEDEDTEEEQNTQENRKDMDSDVENKEKIFSEEEGKPPVPKHIELTITVLNQCLTFLSSSEKEKKLMAMGILSEGIWIVCGCENEVLPLVHKIWEPLSVQFKNTDPLVMRRAFNLLSDIAVIAKDFIRSRTLTKVLPPISTFLLKQAKLSLKKDAGSVYRFSQAYKLQLSLLEGLGDLAIHLDFQEEELTELLTATAPYLSTLQPKPLQDACINTYKKACSINQDVVWLKLAYMGNVFQYLSPPSKDFEVFQAPVQTEFGEEYQKNIATLLQFIND